MPEQSGLTQFMTMDLVREFELNGVVCLRGLIGEDWRRRLAAAIERDLAQPGPHTHNFRSNSGRFHGTSRLRESDADISDYVFNSPLPRLAAHFLNSRKINLLYDQIFVKEPGTEAPSPWHQDHGVWPIKGRKVMSFWVALDPVTLANGGLEWIAGSHGWGRIFQPRTMGGRIYEPNPDFEPMPDIDGERQKYQIVSWDLQPGDALAFHSLTIHGAQGNKTASTRRRACSVRYTGDDVVYDPRPSTMNELVNPALKAGDPLDSDLFPVVWCGDSDGHRETNPREPRMNRAGAFQL
jgi:ectoine hydroxylase-related dioxygenase (phytanoyl-CoA dioxygenase family)